MTLLAAHGAQDEAALAELYARAADLAEEDDEEDAEEDDDDAGGRPCRVARPWNERLPG